MDKPEVKIWKEEELNIKIPQFLSASLFISIFLIILISLLSRQESLVYSKFRMISEGFTILSVLMLVYIVYVNVKYSSIMQENTLRKQTSDITKGTYEDIIDNMAEYYPESYFLLNEIYAYTETPEKDIVNYDPAKRKMLEDVFSDKFLTNIDEFLVLKKYLITNHVGWIINIYYILTTPTIQKYYEKSQIYYSNELYLLYKKIKELQKEDLSEEQVRDKISTWKL